eukprot:1608547-Amphidinium_carterae.2
MSRGIKEVPNKLATKVLKGSLRVSSSSSRHFGTRADQHGLGPKCIHSPSKTTTPAADETFLPSE